MTSKLKAKPPEQHEPTKPKILIYGPPGVGKTWFSLDFPNCYYIDTEAGATRTHYMEKLTKSGGMVMGPEEGALDFDVVIQQLQALATEPHDFKTVVIDSITKLFNTAVSDEHERIINSGKKDEFGTSKKPAIAHMRRLVSWIQRLDMNVLLISHQKEEWGQDSKGERVCIGHTFDCWDKLEYELDLALRAMKQGSSRYGVVRKSRLLGFPDLTQFELKFATFAEMYGKEVIQKKATVIELASAEQIAEITRLVGILKPTEEEVQKLWNKAKAASWAELTSAQAEAVIGSYTKKISK
jgi:KaiC/GvpD/RAD55 family RecA-like ATPase